MDIGDSQKKKRKKNGYRGKKITYFDISLDQYNVAL